MEAPVILRSNHMDLPCSTSRAAEAPVTVAARKSLRVGEAGAPVTAARRSLGLVGAGAGDGGRVGGKGDLVGLPGRRQGAK